MKIIGGYLKGKNFYMPKGIRPTQDIMRKSVFDILGQDLTGLSFLDLFSGSGAKGLEAVSRNARHVEFVEGDIRCSQVISDNLTLLDTKGYAKSGQSYFVSTADAFLVVKNLARQNKRFDIVFVDPPYGLDLAKKILKQLLAYDIVNPNSILIIQHHKLETLPESPGRFLLVRKKKYGDSTLSVYKVS